MSLFDGMAGLLSDVFGAPVIYTPQGGGQPQVVQALLREGPVEVAGSDGHPVLIMAPTLQVPGDVLPGIARRDTVAAVAAPGLVYVVINRLPSGSPAADAMILCELERVDS